MICLQGIGYQYSGASSAALVDVSAQWPIGSLCALVGPNGAGKTTLLRLLCGRLALQKGVLDLPPQWCDGKGRLLSQALGWQPERAGLYSRLRVSEYLQYFASLYCVANSSRRISSLCAQLQIGDLSQRVGKLSQGNRQKLQLARCLLHRPALLLLDEPTANLDPIAKAAVWDILRELQGQDGTTVLVTGHALGEMERHCQQVSILKSGSLLWNGSMANAVKALGALPRVKVRWVGQAKIIPDLSLHGVQELHTSPHGLEYVSMAPESVNTQVLRCLLQAGIEVSEMRIEWPSLEEIYRQRMES